MPVVAVRKRPGLYLNTDTGRYFNLVEYRDDDRYDTVLLASGAITAGTTYNLFRDLGSKDKIDSNFDTPRRLTKGEEMLVKRIWADIPLAHGNVVVGLNDIKKVAYNAYMNVQINQFDVATGPLYKFPSGYGLAGSTTANNNSIATIGVPSSAAVRPLEKVHEITSDHDVAGVITVWNHQFDGTATMPTLDTRVHVRVGIGGLIRRAATK